MSVTAERSQVEDGGFRRVRPRTFGRPARSRLVLRSAWRTQAWERPLRDLGAKNITWSRGFPESVTICAYRFLAHGHELFALAPIHEARITGLRPDQVLALASSAQLAHLIFLDLRWNYVGAAGAQALAASPNIAQLASLDLSEHDIGDASPDSQVSLLS